MVLRKVQHDLNMKMTLQHHHVRSNDELDSLIENRILALQPALRIDEANVRLECRFGESPAFNVHVHLVTPGPDVRTAGRGHTLRAAIQQALTQLAASVRGRDAQRRRRARGNRQAPVRQRVSRGRG